MVPLLDIASYGFNYHNVATHASNYKKETGKLPKWYIKTQKGTFVDIDLIVDQQTFAKEVWLYASTDLFFMLTYDLHINEYTLAKILCNRSTIYTELSSWVTFLSNSLFRLPTTMLPKIEYSMMYEFCLVGTKLVNEYIRFIDQKQFDKCSDEMKEVLREKKPLSGFK